MGSNCYLLTLFDRINPSAICRSYPRGIGFAFHRAGGAGRIFRILFCLSTFPEESLKTKSLREKERMWVRDKSTLEGSGLRHVGTPGKCASLVMDMNLKG